MTAAGELTPKMVKAVSALLSTTSREAAAIAAGISQRTLFRYLKLDAFGAELRRQRSRMLDGATSVLVGGSATCARVLIEVATTGGSPKDAVRVTAARAVLDLAGRFEEMGVLAQRLAELEAAVAATQQTGRARTWPQ